MVVEHFIWQHNSIKKEIIMLDDIEDFFSCLSAIFVFFVFCAIKSFIFTTFVELPSKIIPESIDYFLGNNEETAADVEKVSIKDIVKIAFRKENKDLIIAKAYLLADKGDKAIVHLEKISDLPIAQMLIARIYENGNGVEKNIPEAISWYKKQSENNIEAQFKLASLYENGDGIEKNIPEALNWYKKVAEQTYAFQLKDINLHKYVLISLSKLSEWYLKGENVEQDLFEATKLRNAYKTNYDAQKHRMLEVPSCWNIFDFLKFAPYTILIAIIIALSFLILLKKKFKLARTLIFGISSMLLIAFLFGGNIGIYIYLAALYLSLPFAILTVLSILILVFLHAKKILQNEVKIC